MTDRRLAELAAAFQEWAASAARRDPATARLLVALGSALRDTGEHALAGSAADQGSSTSNQPKPASHIDGRESARESSTAEARPKVVGPRLVESASAKVTGPRSLVPLKLGDLPAIPLAVTGPADAVQSALQSAELSARRAEEAPVRPAFAELPDLERVARRCDLKIQALSLLLRDPDLALETSAEDAERMREKARGLSSMGLWMLSAPGKFDAATLTMTRDVFANLAAALRLATRSRAPLENGRAVPPQSQAEFDILMLLAEAQSALRVLVDRLDLEEDDDDQFAAFAWLRQITERERVFIPRFMRLGDGADPDQAGDLARRIADADGRISGQINARKQLKEARSKIGYHVKHLLKENSPIAADFERIEVGVRNLLASDDSEEVVRSLLAPLMSSVDLWAAAPESLRNLMDDQTDDDQTDAPTRTYSPLVERVRSALAGARVVMTGGEERPHQRERLEQALGLSSLEWITLREHASSEPLLSAIRRPGTRLVLLLVRFAGHAHVEDAQNECRALDLPCILLKAGMNPERVAADIAAQASGVLNISSPNAA